MADSDPRLDREASRAIKRIETQMLVEGKLDKAVAVEGASILLAPVYLAAVGLVAWALNSVGLEGADAVFVGVPLLVGLGLLGLYLDQKR